MAQEKQVAFTVVSNGSNFVDGINVLAELGGYLDGLLALDRDGLDAIIDPSAPSEGQSYVRVTVEYFDTADEAFATSVG